jgi:hypothetical protein
MNKHAREQLEKLTPEQQELIAGVEAKLLLKRERLLRQTRLYRGFYVLPTFLLLAVFAYLAFDSTGTMLLPFSIFALGFLIQFNAAGVNRRVDALIELLDAELKECKRKDDGDAP